MLSKHKWLVLVITQIKTKDNDIKAFIEYPNDMQDPYKNIEEYNIGKKPKRLIVFEDMTAYVINNKKAKSNSDWIVY